MNIKDIAQAKTVKHTIQLDDGQKVDVFLRQMPFYLLWDLKDDNGNDLTQSEVLARRVSYCVVDENNEPVFTYDQVLGNDPNYAMDSTIVLKLATAIGDVFGLGKNLKNDSDIQKSSGVS